ncbi:hypothetical protein ACFL21_01615 [Patescibacteria group bacterium]
MEIKIIFAVLASICGTIGFFPYLWNSLFGKTRPHAFTWLIWMITSGVAVTGLWFGGGGIGSIPSTISLIFVAAVFLVSLRFGKKDIKRSDIIALIAALSAIFIWWQLDSPVLAVVLVSIIDVIGYIPTFRKSFKEPWTETISSWGLFALASIFAILALEEYNLMTLSYLASISFVNTALLIFLFIRRKTITKQSNPPSAHNGL